MPASAVRVHQVYARIESGECTDVKAELNAAYGFNTEQD
jgi:hypothetical protein